MKLSELIRKLQEVEFNATLMGINDPEVKMFRWGETETVDCEIGDTVITLNSVEIEIFDC